MGQVPIKPILILYSDREPYKKFLGFLQESLKARGLQTALLCLRTLVVSDSVTKDYSLLVPCTNDPLIKSTVGIFESLGLKALNRGIIGKAHDRATINATLMRAGLKTPDFWRCLNPAEALSEIPESDYPLILKSAETPKQAIKTFRDSEQLRFEIASNSVKLCQPDSIFYFERQITSKGTYIKLYVCGSNISSYRKYADFRRKPKKIKVTIEFQTIADLVGRSLSLDFFSVDLVEGQQEPTVVDVNSFPIFKYHLDAYDWLADTIKNAVKGAQNKVETT
jgi:hypothetical protein